MSTPAPPTPVTATTAAAASAPAPPENKGGATTVEKTEDQKIDIVSEPQPAENVALPNPATQSTYQRVEKGTRTALLYWDGWLSAQDARLAEDDPNYFGKSGQAAAPDSTTSSTSSASNSAALPVKQVLKRNTNLKKNWTYGKNGEIVYIATGFVGVFDKLAAGGNRSTYSAVGGSPAAAAGSGSNTGSSYGALNLSNYGGKSSPLPKPSGPSVGTAWDLKGNPQNRSAYADVTSGRGNLGGSGGGKGLTPSNIEEADYYGKSDGKNSKKGGTTKKNWSYGKNGEIVYIATGFVGLFDKQPGGAGNRSTYSAVGGSTVGGGSTAGGGGGSNVSSSYGTLNHSNYGGKNSPLPKSSGPSVGTAWDLKGNPQNRSAYADVVSGRGNLGGSGSGKGLSANNNEEADYYGKSDGKNSKKGGPLKKNWSYGKNGEIVYIATGFIGVFDKQPSNASAAAAPGMSPSSHGASSGVRSSSSYSSVGAGSTAGGGGNHAGGVGSPGAAAGSGSNTGSSYGTLNHPHYGGKHSPLPKSSGPSVGTTWDLKGNPQNRSAYADVTSGRGNLGGGGGGKGLAVNNNDDADYFGKSDGKTNKKGAAPVKKNWSYGKNGEIVYIPTGFVGHFDKQHSNAAAAAPGMSPSSHGASSGVRSSSSCSTVGGGSTAGGGGSNVGSSYGTLHHHGNDGRNVVQKSSGPSVGTAWDLKGKSNTRSYYADVKK